MLGAVPCISCVFSVFGHNRAVGTAVACLPDLLVAAVGAEYEMALVIALLRAEHNAVLLIDDCAFIETDVGRVAVCGCAAGSAFGSAVPIGAVDVVSVTHDVSPSNGMSKESKVFGAAAAADLSGSEAVALY
jgi:hypothetical protein